MSSKYRFTQIWILVILAAAWLAQTAKKEDLYKVLGVSKNASQDDIKKSFRKLAKKFHPDANKNRQSWAEKEYIRVNHAYEILSNPEKRKLYDMGGEEAINNQERGSNAGGGGFNFQGGNMEDIINMMFGGGARRGGGFAGGNSHFGGGNQRFQEGHHGFQGGNQGFQGGDSRRKNGHQRNQKKRTGGFGNMGEEAEETPAEELNLTELSMAINLEATNMPDLTTLTENWNIFFYNEESKNSVQAKWVKSFIEKFGIHLKVGLVNCSKQQGLCQKLKINKQPEYYIYYTQSRKIKIDLVDNLPLEFMVQQNIDLMDKKVFKISSANYEEFIKTHISKPIVLSFTERKSTSILLLSLAQLLKDKVVFGEIVKGDALCQKFKIEKYPTMIVLEDPLSYTGNVFTGIIKRETILFWVQDKALNRKSRAQQPGVKELTKERIKMGSCGETDPNLCFVAVVRSPDRLDRTLAILNGLSDSYNSDGFSFYYISFAKANKSELTKMFGDLNTLVVRGKRKRFTGIKDELISIPEKEIRSWLDNLISGGGTQMKSFNSIGALVA